MFNENSLQILRKSLLGFPDNKVDSLLSVTYGLCEQSIRTNDSEDLAIKCKGAEKLVGTLSAVAEQLKLYKYGQYPNGECIFYNYSIAQDDFHDSYFEDGINRKNLIDYDRGQYLEGINSTLSELQEMANDISLILNDFKSRLEGKMLPLKNPPHRPISIDKDSLILNLSKAYLNILGVMPTNYFPKDYKKPPKVGNFYCFILALQKVKGAVIGSSDPKGAIEKAIKQLRKSQKQKMVKT